MRMILPPMATAVGLDVLPRPKKKLPKQTQGVGGLDGPRWWPSYFYPSHFYSPQFFGTSMERRITDKISLYRTA